ncbi:reverse transcriptase domain-containing protein [Tanacetum coccineum]
MIRVSPVQDKKRKSRETTKAWMNIPITFSLISLEDVSDEPLIVEAKVEGYLVRRVYVDEGSSVEVMFEHCFDNLNPEIKARKTSMKFIVVRAPSPYNIILRRTGLKTLRTIPSTIHSMMKFPTPNGIATLVTRTIIIVEYRCLKKKQVVEEEVSEREKEAYVDDMVIKSRDEKMLLADIAKTFDNLRKINMKLNPKKCSFGVEEGKFLGYMVTSDEIRANPKNTKDLADLQSPRTLKEMQSLSGKLAALNPERNYAPMEKLALSLIHMTRRLRRYFEAHPVKVITHQQIKQILSNTEASGKLAKYAVEIGAYNITFVPRNVVKVQVAPERDDMEKWTRFIDGASNQKGSGVGLVLIGPSGVEYTYALRLMFSNTNNEAEYEALLAGLRIAWRMNISSIDAKVDSKLVASQINESYVANKNIMMKYLAKAREYISGFNKRSTEYEEINTIVEEEEDKWMTPIIRCLEEGVWPKDKNESRCLRTKISQYTLEDGVLFKKGYLVPMLRCVGPLQANYVIREIHMGSCGMHSGPRAVVRKAIRHGYYWPTMHEDAKQEVQKCDACQIHSPVPRLPKTLMTSIMAPWPFYQWGMDILEPLSPTRGGAKFVIVAIDYLIKWI